MVELNGRLNKCGVISPRFDVGVKEIETWTARLLPSRQVSAKKKISISIHVYKFCLLWIMSYYKPVNGMCGIFGVSCPPPSNLLAALIKFYQCLFCEGVVVLFISLKSLLLEILVYMGSITVVSFDGIAYGVLHDLYHIGWFLQFGYIVLTTSAGIMDHEEARRKNVGGKVLGFFY